MHLEVPDANLFLAHSKAITVVGLPNFLFDLYGLISQKGLEGAVLLRCGVKTCANLRSSLRFLWPPTPWLSLRFCWRLARISVKSAVVWFHVQGDFCWVYFDFSCSTVCPVLLGVMGIWQKRLGSWAKMAEHPNQSQPNPGLRADESPCTHVSTLFTQPHQFRKTI